MSAFPAKWTAPDCQSSIQRPLGDDMDSVLRATAESRGHYRSSGDEIDLAQIWRALV